MSTGRLILPQYTPVRGRNDQLIPAALLYVYENETTTKANIYTDYDLTTLSSNPVVANASGQFPAIFAEAGTTDEPYLYTVAVTTADGAAPGNPSVFDNYQPSIDYDTAALALAEEYAEIAEAAAAIAVAAAGSLTGSGETFTFTGDGTTTVFTMAEEVEAGAAWTVEVEVAGVTQIPEDPDGSPVYDYSTDGTNQITFTTAPELGAIGVGVHVARSTAITITPPPAAIVPDGRKLSTTSRAARTPDLYDWPTVYQDGSDDGPGVEEAFAYGPVWTLADGELSITTDTTIPVGTMLKVINGTINVAAGVTLTIRGVFDCRFDYHVFTGDGDVVGLDDVSPEFFGAVGDWDESLPGGGAYTDNTDAFNKAVACVLASGTTGGNRRLPRLKAHDRAYGIDGEINIQPSLLEVIDFCGSGWSLAGTGTRFYSAGGGGRIRVQGIYGYADINSNTEVRMSSFSIFPSNNPYTTGLIWAGDGGTDDKVITGLTNNTVTNVTVSDFATNIDVRSVTKLIFQNVYSNSGTVYGRSMYIGLTADGSTCSEIVLSSSVFAQPILGGSGGGVCLYIECSQTNGPAIALVKAVNVVNDTQFYAGHVGRCVVMTCKSAVGKDRSLGDMTFSPGTKFQGNGAFTTTNAIYIEAIDGAKISTIKILGCQLESCQGNAIDMRKLTTGAVYGVIHDVQIQANHFRYHVNRSIYMDGVQGAMILNNNFPYCGSSTGTATEHIYLLNCEVSSVENNKVTQKDASWPGLANGFLVTGGDTTNVRSRNNAMGTATFGSYAAVYPNSGDSADQPSLTVQV